MSCGASDLAVGEFLVVTSAARGDRLVLYGRVTSDICVGDDLEAVGPGGQSVRIRVDSIHAFGRTLERVGSNWSVELHTIPVEIPLRDVPKMTAGWSVREVNSAP